MGQYVHQQIERLLKQKELVEVIELNVQPDHVHLVVEVPPIYISGDTRLPRNNLKAPPHKDQTT